MKGILIVLILLSHSAISQFKPNDIFNAVQNLDYKKTKGIIREYQKAVNLSDTAFHNYTPLMYAVKKGSKRMVRCLVKEGANMEALTTYIFPNYDAFYLAVRYDHHRIVKYFIKQGCDINRALEDGENAVFTAARNNSTRALKILIRHRINLNVNDSNEYGFDYVYPIHWAAMEDHPEIIRLLVKKGAEIEIRDSHMYTPLMSASFVKDTDKSLIELLKLGANPNVSTESGFTPLMMASSKGRLSAVKTLINYGADLNAKTKSGWTALHYSINEKNYELIQFLIEKGADKYIKDNEGLTPMDFALEKKVNNKIIEILK